MNAEPIKTANGGSDIPKARSWEMFNAISPRYDVLNSVLSLGQHIRWRRWLARYLPGGESLTLLDLATGTADVLITLAEEEPRITRGYGLDLAEKMLAIGRDKIRRRGLDGRLVLQSGDAAAIPFPGQSTDAVTMAFGIRNVENPMTVLKEMARVLKPGGRAVILEFSLPDQVLLRLGVIAYLRCVPVIGWLLSGHFQAYRYLNRTIERFPYGEQFCRLMRQVGLVHVGRQPLMLGAATIYYGTKAATSTPGVEEGV